MFLNTKRKTWLLLAVWSLGFAMPVAAQMTDEQIIKYVESGMQSGKSQMQIARELVGKGVSVNQLQRLQSQYGNVQQSSGSSVGLNNGGNGMLGGFNSTKT
ncbi:MAG: hypothetical protein K2M66_06050, partial [Alistipes sp.]|nr:hypothetical protein [Alistipes sp.]